MKRLAIFLLPLFLLCGCRDGHWAGTGGFPKPKYSDSQLSEGLKSPKSEKLDAVSALVAQTLEAVRAEKLPERLPNWIAYHAVLIFGPDSYQVWRNGNADENLSRVFSVMLRSETNAEGAFVLREGKPWPRHSGSYFSQEHHPDQFLNYFSMTGGTLDAKISIDGRQFTMRDLLDRSLLESKADQELDYTVLAYSHYLEPGISWTDKFGETVSFPELLKALLTKDEPTCLGTHRLGALARTLSRETLCRTPEMKKLLPELELQVRTAVYDLKSAQRPDGCFAIPGETPCSNSADFADIYFTGHSLEWILFLGDRFAADDWIVDAVESLAVKVLSNYELIYRNLDAVGSPGSHYDFDGLSHAVSALSRWRKIIEEGKSPANHTAVFISE